MKCTIELFVGDRWITAATFETLKDSDVEQGYKGQGHFLYDDGYVVNHIDERGISAVSCRYPVNFELHRTTTWPAFLLDILPSGAGRRILLEKLRIPDGPTADWQLLLRGGGNVPGNIRIAEGVTNDQSQSHPGFSYNDVIERQESFIEYAYQHGAPVAGSTGAQGDAPKFLLTQDHAGNWHADGALPDSRASKHWLVKFPRGKAESDRLILKNECHFAAVAKKFGLRVKELPSFDSNVLFVPRFDRVVTEAGVTRFGQESLCSLTGIAEFGTRPRHEELCEAIAQFCTDPVSDIKEYVYRDILNVALGNTDNHARNTSISKYPDGRVAVSPLYDFAPMFLDDQGIPRVCRWQEGVEKAGVPEWGKVAEQLVPFGIDAHEFRNELADFAERIERLPDVLEESGVDSVIIERRMLSIKNVVELLRKARKP